MLFALIIALLVGCNSSSSHRSRAENPALKENAAATAGLAQPDVTQNPAGPRITLKNFNSGGVFFGGSKQAVIWQIDGDCDNYADVELSVSRDGGARWFSIGKVEAVKSQVIWSLPTAEGTEYRLKARLLKASEVIAECVSETNFSITCGLPPVTVTVDAQPPGKITRNYIATAIQPGAAPKDIASPLAAEYITAEHTLILTYGFAPNWDANEKRPNPADISKVVLWVTSDGGATWQHLGAFPGNGKGIFYKAQDGRYGFYCAYMTNDGAWTATPAAHSTPQATVVVDSTPPRLEIRSPLAGDQFFAAESNQTGAKIPVLWDAFDDNLAEQTLSILASQDGESWTEIGTTLAATGAFEATLKPSEKPYLLKIITRDAAGNEAASIQEKGFAVAVQPSPRADKNPVLQLERPCGGEVLRGGSEQAVIWKSIDLPENVKEIVAEFYDGEKWREIRRVSDPSGAFIWHVPESPGADCRVRLSADLKYKTITSESGQFTIDTLSPTSEIAIADSEADNGEPAAAGVVSKPDSGNKQPAPPPHGEEVTDIGSLIQAVIKIDTPMEAEVPQMTATPPPASGSEDASMKNVEELAKDTARLERQRLIDEAFNYLNHQDWIMAESKFKSLLKKYADDPEVLYGMGRFYYDQQRYEEAEQQLLRAVTVSPAHARAHYYLGKIALHSTAHGVTNDEVRFTNAEMRFKKAIEADSKLAEAHNDLATLYFEKKKFAEALNFFGRAVDADPANKIYLYNYGRTAFELGQYNLAIEFCQKALKIDENFPHPYWFIAKSYTKQRNWAQARVYWQKVIDKFGFDKRLQAQAVIELKNAQAQK